MSEKITHYKLPLDEDYDQDIITWINAINRSKKAEVIRHALRFYKSFLKEGEMFIMPSGTPPVIQQEVGTDVEKKIVGIKKVPVKGLGSLIKSAE